MYLQQYYSLEATQIFLPYCLRFRGTYFTIPADHNHSIDYLMLQMTDDGRIHEENGGYLGGSNYA